MLSEYADWEFGEESNAGEESYAGVVGAGPWRRPHPNPRQLTCRARGVRGPDSVVSA
jgi:hypothetical protein